MRETRAAKIGGQINAFVLLLIALTCLAPVVNILSISFSGKTAVETGQVYFWPVDFSLFSYKLLFDGTRIVQALFNGIEVTLVGIVLSMIFTICAAYPLSKGYFLGRRPYTLLILFTLVFNGGIIPTYLVLKWLGLINTYGALWLPGMISAYNMLVMKSYFESLPSEVEDAARIDGCNEWRLLLRIVLPLSMPVLATMILFYGVSYWNMFMNVLIYINSTEKYTITVLIQQMIQSQAVISESLQNDAQSSADLVPMGIQSAGIMILIFPMAIIYPFLQKYFVKGIMLGSVKG